MFLIIKAYFRELLCACNVCVLVAVVFVLGNVIVLTLNMSSYTYAHVCVRIYMQAYTRMRIFARIVVST